MPSADEALTGRPPDFESRYAAILSACPEATFFHTRTWAAILAAAFPGIEDLSQILEIAGRPHAAPLFRRRRWGGAVSSWHSSFPFLYGGPVPATPEALQAFQLSLARLPGGVVLIGNPFAAPRESAATGAAGAPAPPPAGPLPLVWDTTHLLQLPADVETYWSTVLDTRKRNDIRRLSRKGVIVETTRDERDVRAIYTLYRQRMATWRRRPRLVYPLALYSAMVRLGGEAARCYVARHAGRVIGGTFITRWNGIVHYNAGYFDDAARPLRPNVLIQERIIRDAIEEGGRIYDMLPSAGLANVETFKESFGGVRTPFPRWERLSALARWTGRVRRWARRPQERPAHDD